MGFSQDWFSKNIPIWIILLEEFRGRSGLRVLEIGGFEGRSTCWLLENVLTGEGSTIDCIDTFADGMRHRYRGIVMAAARFRFEANTGPVAGAGDAACRRGRAVAAKAFRTLRHHLHRRLPCRRRRIGQHGSGLAPLRPQMAIDAYLQCFTGWYQALHFGYQVAIRKLSVYQPPASIAASASSLAVYQPATPFKASPLVEGG